MRNSVLLVLLLLASCTQSSELTIGFATPLTGEAALWGVPVREGFDFALQEHREKTGKGIHAVYENTECDPGTGINAYTKLITLNDVDVITGTVCSSVVFSTVNLTREYNVLHLASGATHPDATKLGSHIFRLWVSDAYEAVAVANFAHEQDLRTLAVTYMNDNPAGIALRDAFEDALLEKGSELVAEESYSKDVRDFRTIALRIFDAKPEGVFIVAPPDQTDLLVNELSILGYDDVIFIYSPSATEEVLERIHSTGHLFAAVPQDIRQTSFWDDFEHHAGKPADTLNALGYDSFQLILQGFEKCGKEIACMEEYFISMDGFESSRGTLRFDENGDLQETLYELRQLS